MPVSFDPDWQTLIVGSGVLTVPGTTEPGVQVVAFTVGDGNEADLTGWTAHAAIESTLGDGGVVHHYVASRPASASSGDISLGGFENDAAGVVGTFPAGTYVLTSQGASSITNPEEIANIGFPIESSLATPGVTALATFSANDSDTPLNPTVTPQSGGSDASPIASDTDAQGAVMKVRLVAIEPAGSLTDVQWSNGNSSDRRWTAWVGRSSRARWFLGKMGWAGSSTAVSSVALFVAVGDNGKLATSPDGISWTQRTSGFGATFIQGVGWSPQLGLFVAVGGSGKLTTSPDGITWTARTSGFGSTFINDVAWSPQLGLFVIVGGSGTLATSSDGITWTTRTSGFGSTSIRDVAWSPQLGLFVAVGSSGTLTTSPDGITWTTRTSGFGSSNINSVVWSPALGLFVAVGGQVGVSGKIGTSPDGVTWTQQTSGFGATAINYVAWSPQLGLFAAVGDAGKIGTSPDGVTWTQQTSGFGPGGEIYGCAWSPALGLFVAAGLSGLLRTSPDGVTWTGQTSGFGASAIFDVTWGP